MLHKSPRIKQKIFIDNSQYWSDKDRDFDASTIEMF